MEMSTCEMNTAQKRDLLPQTPAPEQSLVKFGSGVPDMVVAVSNSAPAPQPQAETHVSESMASTQHPAFEDKKPKSLTIRPKDLGLKVLYEPKDVDDIKLEYAPSRGMYAAMCCVELTDTRLLSQHHRRPWHRRESLDHLGASRNKGQLA